MQAHLRRRRPGLGPWLRTAAALWTIASSCGGSSSPPGERVLRVGAPFGLSSLRDLNQVSSGTNANIIDLVLDPMDKHATVVRHDGRFLYLRALPHAAPTTLALSLRAAGLVSTQVNDNGELVVEFKTPEDASNL